MLYIHMLLYIFYTYMCYTYICYAYCMVLVQFVVSPISILKLHGFSIPQDRYTP